MYVYMYGLHVQWQLIGWQIRWNPAICSNRGVYIYMYNMGMHICMYVCLNVRSRHLDWQMRWNPECVRIEMYTYIYMYTYTMYTYTCMIWVRIYVYMYVIHVRWQLIGWQMRSNPAICSSGSVYVYMYNGTMNICIYVCIERASGVLLELRNMYICINVSIYIQSIYVLEYRHHIKYIYMYIYEHIYVYNYI